ncbi:MAG: hypothetical protein JKY37_28285 [Nannocystaceae bacterium]|nr:hypothetical protein [Nannocystaceae bacterium]
MNLELLVLVVALAGPVVAPSQEGTTPAPTTTEAVASTAESDVGSAPAGAPIAPVTPEPSDLPPLHAAGADAVENPLAQSAPRSSRSKVAMPLGWELLAGSKRGISPTNRGKGFLVAAGIVGGIGLSLKLAHTGVIVKRNRESGCTDRCLDRPGLVGLGYNSVFAISLGFLGAGMGLRGRWLAYAEAYDRPGPVSSLAGVHPVAGWSLVGTGVALWVATRISARACERRCFIAVSEIGYYPSTALVAAGIAMGAFATSHKMHKHYIKTQLSAAPFVGKGLSGLSLSGYIPL